jgi:nucleotide-binding universal stress UspA family protein
LRVCHGSLRNDVEFAVVRFLMKQSAIVRWSDPQVILVATNLLEGHTLMLHAIYQAKLSRAKVLLVHVVPPSHLDARADNRMPTIVPSHLVRNVKATLEAMAEVFEREGIECEPIVLRGVPGQQIPLLIGSRSVDRVIVANRNVNGVSRLVDGSVAEDLIADSGVPVCIIGRRAHAGAAGGTSLKRILLATSFEPGCALLARFASTLAELNDSDLTLLHVVNPVGISEQQRELAKFTARQELMALIPNMSRHRQQPQCLVREGDPASIIAKECSSMSQDLLILGSPYPSVLSWLLKTSILHRAIVESKCPVLTLRLEGPKEYSFDSIKGGIHP